MSMSSLRVFLVAATIALGGCQASTVAPAAVAAVEAEGPRIGLLTAERSSLTGLRESDLVMSDEAVSGPQTLAITYRRGVEERLSWNGTGHGVAELTNAYGQQVYRVEEGAAPKTVLVPAGAYTLTVRPDASRPAAPLSIAVEPSATGQTRHFFQPEPPDASRAYQQDLCEDIVTMLRRMGDLERRIQFRQEQAVFFPEYNRYPRENAVTAYVQARAALNGLFALSEMQAGQRRGGRDCSDLKAHRPNVTSLDTSNALLFPYAFHWYKDRFK